MTKGAIGASPGGLIHIIWKEHGPYPCRDFVSDLQLVVNCWLHQHGFTVGVQDIIARPETVISIKETLTAFKRKVQKTL
jgi:DNA-directed RNA polymerase II subunit RPB1